MNTIARTELLDLIEHNATYRLFEVLPEKYWAAGHIPTARVMPLDRIGETAARFAPDKEEAVVVYCSSDTCKNSHIAAEKLTELGYRSVRVFTGGKAEWKNAGLSLEVPR